MGEAFRRKRAARFDHLNHRHYQAFVERDLLRIARATETHFEVSARLTNGTTGLVVGSHCLVRERGGEYDVLHGNIVVARLPAEAKDTLTACTRVAPSFNGVLPCRVSRIGAFSGISLKLGGDSDGS